MPSRLPDFSGWATKNDLLCTDGRTIKKDAFKHCDGKQVPLVWNHDLGKPSNVLGYCILHNRDEGVYADAYFNENEDGEIAKGLVTHGDVRSLSIRANRLREFNKNVIHGDIIEVSLVPSGANPGAFIETVLAHGDEQEDSMVFGYDEPIVLYHADEDTSEKEEKKEDTSGKEEKKEDSGETVEDVFNTLTDKQKTVVYAIIGAALEGKGANEEKEVEHADGDSKEETVEDVFNTLSEKQKTVVYALIGAALQNNKEDDTEMKHNVFETDQPVEEAVLTHSDQENILKNAKSVGSFRKALEDYAEENEITHADDLAPISGFPADNIGLLFPEYKDVRPGMPDLITDDQGWIDVIMRKVHKSPFSRIRTRQVDIRNIDALKAKGYVKGKKKALTGNYRLALRTTDPQTIYVKNALNRDDILDITDFDYVQYQYNIDKMMLNEEIATAVMITDGRQEGDPDWINPEHVRPVWQDDDLYTIHVDVDLDATTSELQGTNTHVNFGENFIYAESVVNAMLYARENFKGTGTPDMYCDPHLLNVMLLARDRNGRRIYDDKTELARALNVANIYTVEQFANKTREVTISDVVHTKKLLALVVNMADYAIGSTRGGQVTHFSQFDIDFNQQKSLIETRISGALTRVYSAIALEEDVTSNP